MPYILAFSNKKNSAYISFLFYVCVCNSFLWLFDDLLLPKMNQAVKSPNWCPTNPGSPHMREKLLLLLYLGTCIRFTTAASVMWITCNYSSSPLPYKYLMRIVMNLIKWTPGHVLLFYTCKISFGLAQCIKWYFHWQSDTWCDSQCFGTASACTLAQVVWQ